VGAETLGAGVVGAAGADGGAVAVWVVWAVPLDAEARVRLAIAAKRRNLVRTRTSTLESITLPV
jgi:hypothetical protein